MTVLFVASGFLVLPFWALIVFMPGPLGLMAYLAARIAVPSQPRGTQ